MADLQTLDAGDGTAEQGHARNSRRNFFKVAGGAAGAAALVVAGCDTAGVKPPGTSPGNQPGSTPGNEHGDVVTFDFSTDIGVLNFAYALEQLEATFYVMACNNFYGGPPVEEYYLAALRSHENAHAVFLREALGENAIPDLEFDFSSVTFSDRASVLGTARVLEDVGVSAYNGAGSFLENPTFLAYAGKIVSVEARHAAAIRELVGNETFFADLTTLVDLGAVPENGLDAALPPADVIALAQPFVVQDLQVLSA